MRSRTMTLQWRQAAVSSFLSLQLQQERRSKKTKTKTRTRHLTIRSRALQFLRNEKPMKNKNENMIRQIIKKKTDRPSSHPGVHHWPDAGHFLCELLFAQLLSRFVSESHLQLLRDPGSVVDAHRLCCCLVTLHHDTYNLSLSLFVSFIFPVSFTEPFHVLFQNKGVKQQQQNNKRKSPC